PVATIAYPAGITLDRLGNIYVADTNFPRILKISTQLVVTTYAGNGTVGYSGDGVAAATAQLAGPLGVSVDSAGNVYFADQLNHRVRKVGTDGKIVTVAGTGNMDYSGDGGPATQAALNYPKGTSSGSSGYVYIADYLRVRRVSPDGAITTIAGNG